MSSTTKVVYAADTANNVVDMFGLVTIPDPTGCGVSAVTTTSATLHGEVDPHKTRAESFFQTAQLTPLAWKPRWRLWEEVRKLRPKSLWKPALQG